MKQYNATQDDSRRFRLRSVLSLLLIIVGVGSIVVGMHWAIGAAWILLGVIQAADGYRRARSQT